MDKACTIESILYNLSFRRNDLVEQKAVIEKDALHLMHELQHTMHVEEDLTVIGAEAFSSEDIIPEAEIREDQLLIDSTSNDQLPLHSSNDEHVAPRRNGAQSNDGFIGGWFRGFYPSSQKGETRQETDRRRDMLTNNTKVSSAMLASAESWRRRNGREAATKVDFRTGLSGHLGALGHHAHVRHQVETGLPKMSCHGGLTVRRGVGKVSSRDSTGSRIFRE